jgi:hypothetical protein
MTQQKAKQTTLWWRTYGGEDGCLAGRGHGSRWDLLVKARQEGRRWLRRRVVVVVEMSRRRSGSEVELVKLGLERKAGVRVVVHIKWTTQPRCGWFTR